MSYEKMMKWNRKHRKGTRQPVLMHTESGFTPSIAFLDKYFKYREQCEAAGIEPAGCEEYYNNRQKHNEILKTEVMNKVNKRKIANLIWSAKVHCEEAFSHYKPYQADIDGKEATKEIDKAIELLYAIRKELNSAENTVPERALVLSTAHITPKTDKVLGNQCLGPVNVDNAGHHPLRIVAHHYGYIIFVKMEMEPEDLQKIKDETPDLIPIIEFAIAKQCPLINLDRDAAEFKELPTYEWQ